MSVRETGEEQALPDLQGLRAEAGPPLHLDQQLRGTQQLPVVQLVDRRDGGVARVRCSVGLRLVGREAAGEAGPLRADQGQREFEEVEHRPELGRVLALLGLGDQCRVEGGECDDAHHVEFPARHGVSGLSRLLGLGGHDHERKRQVE